MSQNGPQSLDLIKHFSNKKSQKDGVITAVLFESSFSESGKINYRGRKAEQMVKSH